MFQDNLKALRKEKGITQEELAARLNVVRQTVSKWEKGLSVPDSDLLIKLAEILDVPVSRLLGSKIETEAKPDALAEQLSRINEQLAIKKGGQRESVESVSLYYRWHYCDVHLGHNRFYHVHYSSNPFRYRRNSTSRCWNGDR